MTMTTHINIRLFIGAILLLSAGAFSFFQTGPTKTTSPNGMGETCPPTHPSNDLIDRSRRNSFASIIGTAIGGAAVLSSPAPALAAADCMKDCVKNCLIIAPKVSSVQLPTEGWRQTTLTSKNLLYVFALL